MKLVAARRPDLPADVATKGSYKKFGTKKLSIHLETDYIE